MLSLFRPVFADETAQNYYDLGVFAYEDGNYAEAEQFLTKAVKMDPENVPAHFYLGKTYFQQKRLKLTESHLQKAASLNPEFPGLRYALGLLYYKKMEFETALNHFKKVPDNDADQVLGIYYGGICQYKTEDYAGAEISLRAAAEMSPTIAPNANYYAGVCNYHLGRLDASADHFHRVADTAAADDLRENARLWIKAIEKKRADLTPWSFYVKTAYVYDDNVVLEPADQDIVSNEKDSAVMAYFSGDYDVIRESRLTAGLSYSHYQTWYQDLKEYDLTGSIGNVYLDYRCTDAWTLGIKYLPTYYWVDSNSYLMRHHIRSSLAWTADLRSFVEFSHNYYRDHYFTDSGRDGHANEISVDYSRAIGALNAYFFCGIGYEINSATDDDEDFEELKTLLGISWDVFARTNFTIYGNYYDKDYDAADAVYGRKRDDDRYSLSAALTQNIWKEWLYGGIEYNYTKNDSNIGDFDYERNLIRLFIAAKF